jgi:hypothetical protein
MNCKGAAEKQESDKSSERGAARRRRHESSGETRAGGSRRSVDRERLARRAQAASGDAAKRANIRLEHEGLDVHEEPEPELALDKGRRVC